MLLGERRAWLLKGMDEAAETVSAALPIVPRRIVSPEAMTNGGRALPRYGPLVVTDQALRDPSTAAMLVGLSLTGRLRLLRPRQYYEQALRRVLLNGLDESWFVFDWPAHRVHAVVKQGMDFIAGLIGSLLALLLVAPLWFVSRLTDGGPVFYRQERVGCKGQTFLIWKFRTMRVGAEADGPLWAAVKDDRCTPFGRFLRQTHLDELPQFFNVLCREMSLIGPRPERPVFIGMLSEAVPFFERRHLMRPGITGWGVVRFGYSDCISDKWVIHEYDLYYLKHRSIALDLEIIARTLVAMVTLRGR